MIPAIYNTTVDVRRRIDVTSASRDILNNPIYGDPAAWGIVYTAMPARLAFSSKDLQFASTGERITPSGIMYYQVTFTLFPQDRVITQQGVEYVVADITTGYLNNVILDHYTCKLLLP
jgi:hypothetical protein